MIYKQNTNSISLCEIMTIDEAELFEFTESEMISLNEGFAENVKQFFIKLKNKIIQFFTMIIKKIRSIFNNDKKDLNDLNNAVKQSTTTSNDSESDAEDGGSDNDSEAAGSPIQQAVKIAKRAHFRDKYNSLEQVLEAGFKSSNFVIKDAKPYLARGMDTNVERMMNNLYSSIKEISQDLLEKDELFGVNLVDGIYQRDDLAHNINTKLCRDIVPSDNGEKGFQDIYMSIFLGTMDYEYGDENENYQLKDNPELKDLYSKDLSASFPKLTLQVLSKNSDDEQKFIDKLDKDFAKHVESLWPQALQNILELEKIRNQIQKNEHKKIYIEKEYRKIMQPIINKERMLDVRVARIQNLLNCFFEITRNAVRFIMARHKFASKAVLSMIRAAYKDMNDVKTESYDNSIFSNIVLI